MSGYAVINPATGETVEKFPFPTEEELESVLATAAAAQREWAARTIAERAAVVNRAAALFTERKAELAEIIGIEMGKRLSEGVEEAEFSADILAYYADHAETFSADLPLEANPGDRAVVERKPIGVILGIMPWNFPYYQVARFAAPNLMVGNAVIVKHAEICPRSAAAIEQIMVDAGLPAGLYTNVYASHDQISTLIADRRIAGVSLTGSERAGRKVAAQAGANLKKAVLELGGSDPYIVLDTEDVKAAADLAWSTRMYNTGQVCNANKRLIVSDDIYDEFVAELERLAKLETPGDYTSDDPSVYQPLSSRRTAEGLAAQLRDAAEAGAHIVGGELSDQGAYVSPAVVTGIPVGSEVYYQELFGPVAIVFKVSSDAEAVELANNTQFGLGASVWSTDLERAERVGAQLDAGMVQVNTAAGEGAQIPFGGVKNSGFGRELGPIGMDEFVNKRLYYVGEKA
jgi:succinate-semialdehyde dehydrogenase/glutarate-semialdehyde dehydrogenase